ncbi:LuxR C-terminal-related transcriptional regulator [Pseudorhizobium flavum]|uniref:LuxR C-terminal-related transcriptional regulator n=1 Tax=Pseudorhizobium flavum TaxID=1335061 RepID=UPI002491D083|nr:response regulator transcription factor [Pseudorhizobium flavum]
MRNHAIFLIHQPGPISEIVGDIELLKAENNPPWIVLLAKSMEPDQLAASFVSGVDGYLLDDISPEALLESLHLVTLGEKVFPSQLAVLMCGNYWKSVRTDVPKFKDADLSEREILIVQGLTEGCPNKILAHKLNITEATVKVHVKAVLKKLGVRNRTQAAIWAIQSGLWSPPELFRLNADNGSQRVFRAPTRAAMSEHSAG